MTTNNNNNQQQQQAQKQQRHVKKSTSETSKTGPKRTIEICNIEKNTTKSKREQTKTIKKKNRESGLG